MPKSIDRTLPDNEAAAGGMPSGSRVTTVSGEPVLAAPRMEFDREPIDAFAQGALSRQVVIDRAYHPVGYEFGLRSENAQPEDNAVHMLIGLIGRFGGERLAAGRQSWLRLHQSNLDETMVRALDPASVILVVEITPLDAARDSAYLEMGRALRAAGYRLALANWKSTPLHVAWLAECKFVEVDIAAANPMEAGDWPKKITALAPGIEVVAFGVDSWEELEFCHRAKYHFFRGSFLTRRENWPRQPRTNPERMRICALLNRLHAGAELNEISEQLKQSPELSYRLLRYINSAGVGLMVRVASVHRGLVILGRDKVYRWLTLLLFNSGQGKSLDNALLEQALARARMMELLAGKRFDRMRTEELFVIGIFSMIDMLLKLPMSVALEPLKLPDAVQQALLGQGGEYAPFLDLVVASEEGKSEILRSAGSALGIELSEINSAQLEALVWAQQTLSQS